MVSRSSVSLPRRKLVLPVKLVPGDVAITAAGDDPLAQLLVLLGAGAR
jgi:hypothetical protein